MNILKNYYKYLIIIAIAIVLIILLFPRTNTKVLKCTIDEDLVKGIHLKDSIRVNLVKGKLKDVKVDKSIDLSDDYTKFDTYKEIMEMHLKSSFQYLDENDYSINVKDNTLNLKSYKLSALNEAWFEKKEVIYVERNTEFGTIEFDEENFIEELEQLRVTENSDFAEIRAKLREVVPTYTG